jgi:ribosome-associated translation inhibitor RaiA
VELDIRIGDIDADDALRRYVRRRIGFALGRFSPSLRRVTTRVSAVSAIRGGVDAECRTGVRLIRSGSIVLMERGPDVYAMIDRNIERLGRGLARHVDLGRRSDSNNLRGGRPDSRERSQ